jgi:hypothetical protein
MTGGPVLQVALLQLVLQPVTGDGRVRENRRLRPADGGVGEEELSCRRRRQNLFLCHRRSGQISYCVCRRCALFSLGPML